VTDYELNRAIAGVLGMFMQPPKGLDTEIVGDVLHYYDKTGYLTACHLDYCCEWNDLMPLVVEHKININYDMLYPRWVSTKTETNGIDDFWEGVISVNENPQRALAECLLKVLEGDIK